MAGLGGVGTLQAHGGGGDDDGAATGLDQIGPRAVAHVVHQIELVLDAIGPDVGGHLAEGSHARVRRVVDDDINTTHELGAVGHPLLHGLVVGKIHVETRGLVALGHQLVGHLGSHALGASGAAHEGSLSAQQLLGHAANALGGAGQQHALTFQSLAQRLLRSDELTEIGSANEPGDVCHNDSFLESLLSRKPRDAKSAVRPCALRVRPAGLRNDGPRYGPRCERSR